MADAPQYLTLKNNRDRSERVELASRRTFFGLVSLLLVASLLGVFGQRPTDTLAASPVADLHVFAPTRLRGGLYWEARTTVLAKAEIKKATLAFEHGWTEQMQINTIEPSPIGEASRNGRLTLDFGHLAPGDRLVVYMQFQVNPTNVGHRPQDVSLYDDTTLLATAHRAVTVFP